MNLLKRVGQVLVVCLSLGLLVGCIYYRSSSQEKPAPSPTAEPAVAEEPVVAETSFDENKPPYNYEDLIDKDNVHFSSSKSSIVVDAEIFVLPNEQPATVETEPVVPPVENVVPPDDIYLYTTKSMVPVVPPEMPPNLLLEPGQQPLEEENQTQPKNQTQTQPKSQTQTQPAGQTQKTDSPDPSRGSHMGSSKSLAPIIEPTPAPVTPEKKQAVEEKPEKEKKSGFVFAPAGGTLSWVSRLLLSVLISFGFLLLVFRPLEMLFPAAKGQKFIRPAFFTDLSFFLGQYLVFASGVLWVLAYFNGWLTALVPSSFRLAVAGQVWWLQAIEVIVLSDVIIYWGHRLQHRVGFLWRFHKVHHSAERLDWLAAHREHPVDSIYTIGLINLPAVILGFPLETLIGFIVFRGIWAIFIHSNVRLPIGPLRWFIGAPELHHWHHAKDRDAGNYANISPLMDILFGTYVCPDHEPEAFGLPDEEETPRTYLGQLIRPLLPQRRS